MDDFRPPRVMGIINCTPDSFYDGSRHSSPADAAERAVAMVRDGADIIDIGGESTRPGAAPVDDADQIHRVVPAIREIRKRSTVSISIDTRSARVAEAALDAGADIINDISALAGDRRMSALAAEREVPVVLMHMQGTPETMQTNPEYADVGAEVRRFLQERVDRALAAGIKPDRIILDPGIGFGKGPGDNEALLARPSTWRIPGYPVLIGLSRKSFLGRILEAERSKAVRHVRHRVVRTAGSETPTGPGDAEERLTATLAAQAWCLMQGVDILRVHDVREARDLIAVWEALSWAS